MRAPAHLLAVLGLAAFLAAWTESGGEILYSGKPAEFWLKALDDPDHEVRLSAVESLSELSTEAGTLVPRLLARAAAERDPEIRRRLALIGAGIAYNLGRLENDPQVRKNAADSFYPVHAPPLDALAPGLEALLGEPDPKIRKAAAEALAQLGKKHAAPARAALHQLLTDTDEEVRDAASEALSRFGGDEAEAALAVVANAGRSRLGDYMFVRRLVRIGPSSIPVLARMIGDESRSGFAWPSDVLPKECDAMLEALEDRLGGDDRAAREQALVVLAALGKHGQPALVAALDHPEASVRERVVIALWKRSGAAKDAGPALARVASRDASPTVRRKAAESLVDVRIPESSYPAVVALLASDDEAVRCAAAAAVAAFDGGGTTRDFLRFAPAMAKALRDPSEAVRQAAAYAFVGRRAEVRAVRPALEEALADDARGVRENVALALCAIGGELGPTLDRVLAVLDASAPRVRAQVARALRDPAKTSQPVLLALVARLGDVDPAVRGAFTQQIASIGTPAVAFLGPQLGRCSEPCRSATLATLAAIGAGAAPVVPTVIAVVQEDPRLAYQAEPILRAAGADAVPALRAALADDPAPELRQVAERLLARLEGRPR